MPTSPDSSNSEASENALSTEKSVDASALRDVLEALARSAGEDEVAVFKALSEQPVVSLASKAIELGNLEAWYFGFQYPLKRLERGLLNAKLSNPKARFVFEELSFIETYLKRLFRDYEGSFACADKMRMVLRSWVRHLQTNKPIVWDYEQEYTYHLPQRILRTHKDIAVFFQAVYQLRYGNITPYYQMVESFGPPLPVGS